jgi:hypothetical protein
MFYRIFREKIDEDMIKDSEFEIEFMDLKSKFET